MLRSDLVLPASGLGTLFFNAGDEYVVRNVVINLISLTKNYHEGRPPVPLPLCPPRPSVGGRLAAKAAREGILWGGSKAERGRERTRPRAEQKRLEPMGRKGCFHIYGSNPILGKLG